MLWRALKELLYPYPKLACFVLYLEIINTFNQKQYMHLIESCPRNLKDLAQFPWKSAYAPKKVTSERFFVTESDENHIMSLFNPILDIPIRSSSFDFQWNLRNFNKLFKSSVKTQGCIVFNLSSHYTGVGLYDLVIQVQHGFSLKKIGWCNIGPRN